MPETITSNSRAIVTELVVFMFGFVWVVDWYLKWTLSGPPIDSSVCVIWIIVGP